MLPRFPNFRSSLLRMHRDLIYIDQCSYSVNIHSSLNKLEIFILILEDRNFFNHSGFSIKSLGREFWRYISGRRHGGASTIEMQLFRTASGRYERTLRRKIREIVGSVILQFRLSKIAILRIYLDIAYFGTGLSGAEIAANSMFSGKAEVGKSFDFSKLSLREAAELASLLVYPKPRLFSADWHAKVSRRADYALMLYTRFEKQINQSSSRHIF